MDAPCAPVIISNAQYVRPLSFLLRSMRAANVTYAVLVMSDPQHAGANDVLCQRHEEGVRLSEIRTQGSNFEYLGFQKLQQHLNHSFLQQTPLLLDASRYMRSVTRLWQKPHDAQLW